MAEERETDTCTTAELEDLKRRLEEAEQTLEAIRTGHVDALVVETADGNLQIFTLEGAEWAYRVLVETMSEGALSLAPDGMILYSNERFAQMVEVPLEQVIGSSVASFIAPEDRSTIEALLSRAGEGVARAEAKLQRSTAATVPVQLSVSGFEVGEYPEACLIVTDLTLQKWNEEIFAAERLARSILEQAREVILVCDEDGTVVRASAAAYRMAGTNLLFQPFDSVFRLASDSGEPISIRHILNGKELATEAQLSTEAGTIYLLANGGPLVGPDGVSIGGVITLTDITERKLAEMQVRESEERYRAIFDLAGTSKCLVGRDLRIASCNKEFERLTGYGAEEIAGREIHDFFIVEDMEVLTAQHGGIRADKPVTPVHFETRMKAKGGDVVDVIVYVAYLPLSDNFIISFADITMEKVYARQLEERAQQLSDFLSIASHELGIPVTIIKGYAQTLSRHPGRLAEEATKEILTALDMSANRLQSLVEELLDVSRIQTGHMTIEKSSFELEPLILRVVKEMQMTAGEHMFKVQLGSSLRANSDSDKIGRVLMVLLENAFRYSPSTSVVEVEAEMQEADILISVMDRGPGIAEQYREKVFDAFSRGGEELDHHSSSGLGLGLYIARQIVKALGGRIWNEPREGGGTSFRFTLPQA